MIVDDAALVWIVESVVEIFLVTANKIVISVVIVVVVMVVMVEVKSSLTG